MQFEFYVLNHDFNRNKVEMFNIFRNIYVQEWTEKAIKKYLRNPKKFKYESFFNKEVVYGFDGLCKEIESILRHELWSRCEYEVAVGSLFTTELKDIVREVDRGEIETDNLYDVLKKKSERNGNLEKIDCFYQAQPNIPMIVRECIYQYKQQLKAKEETSENSKE